MEDRLCARMDLEVSETEGDTRSPVLDYTSVQHWL